jgi:hypothetical protein
MILRAVFFKIAPLAEHLGALIINVSSWKATLRASKLKTLALCLIEYDQNPQWFGA